MHALRLYSCGEVGLAGRFIEKNLREGHVLSADVDFFNWMYRNRLDGSVLNMVGHYNLSEKNFNSMLGFMPLSHFDSALPEFNATLGPWMVKKKNGRSCVNGLELVDFLFSRFTPVSLGSVGVNPATFPLYRVMKFKDGYMSQYYIANDRIFDYRMIKNPLPAQPSAARCPVHCVRFLEDVDDLGMVDEVYFPRKSIEYVINRYLRHPLYRYRLLGVYDGRTLLCAFVTREAGVSGARCLRIVDVYGRLERIGSNIVAPLLKILYGAGYEYIDCYNYGVPAKVFENLGFVQRQGDEIVPNYFEPFERSNVDIGIAYKSAYDEYVIFRGDGDQDRPNIVR